MQHSLLLIHWLLDIILHVMFCLLMVCMYLSCAQFLSFPISVLLALLGRINIMELHCPCNIEQEVTMKYICTSKVSSAVPTLLHLSVPCPRELGVTVRVHGKCGQEELERGVLYPKIERKCDLDLYCLDALIQRTKRITSTYNTCHKLPFTCTRL